MPKSIVQANVEALLRPYPESSARSQIRESRHSFISFLLCLLLAMASRMMTVIAEEHLILAFALHITRLLASTLDLDVYLLLDVDVLGMLLCHAHATATLHITECGM